ncbi:DUF4232 domain-containing protein [Streptomyces kanamyceticus]|uniref:DUF4232 domain-containing protein n=2 Tax=Streptomyces kanamyceticus TaxID=1967 RepID=A0A5J6G9R7_STRKN|nr:DUF4232 domain-containing protein [Streptomyces kanamyceticus]QEU90668.1 DUF4232 domain-containing protein [Streptomyces kanamyceticus]
MTVIPRPFRQALALSATALLVAGCGLSAELDREANPEREPRTEATRPEPTRSAPGAPGDLPPSPDGPSATASPAPATPRCPKSGVTMSPGMVTAAMGLRAMSVTVTNCGKGVRQVNGYPDIRVRGLDKQLFRVNVLKGTEPVTTMDDPGPRRVTLKPGESAYTSLVWRYSAVDAATREGSGVYVEIGTGKGAARQTIEPDGGLDIGETGMLGTTAWQRSPADEGPRRPDARPTAPAPSTPAS